MVIEGLSGVLVGFFLREWARAIGSMFRKKEKPASSVTAPLPAPRDVGDLVLDTRNGLPAVLLEQLSHDKFRACYITPGAKALGAIIGKKDEGKQVDELDTWLAINAQDRNVWPDYPHKLSDGEHANYAKAMLTEGK